MSRNELSGGRKGAQRRSRSSDSRVTAEPLEPRAYLSAAFTGPTFVTNIRGVTAMASGDLSGSGHPDVVVAGLSPSSLSTAVVGVFPNRSGSLGTPTVYPLGTTAGGVAVGDFRGNGRQDIAATDPSNNQLVSLLNNGSASFTPGATSTLPGSGGDIQMIAADFNGDGKDDLAVVDPNDNQVVIAFSNGDGSFAVQSPIAVPGPLKIVAADFNADGRADLGILGGQSPNSLYIAINNGNGTFAAPVTYSFGPDAASIADIAAADFNGDGAADVVGVGASTSGASVAAVMLNQGHGLFASASDVPLPGVAANVVTGNFSGSGHPDVAAIGAAGSLDLLPGNGDGTFGADQTLFSNQLATPGAQAVTADFDANGAPDIAYVSRSQGGFGLLLNSGGSASGAAAVAATAVSGKLPTKPLVAGGKVAPITQTLTLAAPSASFTGAVTINLQFSLTNSFNPANPTVATITRRVSLKAGRSQRLAVVVRSVPSGLAGPYFLVAQVTDPSGAASTAASAGTVGIVAPTIDLSGGFAVLPRAARAGRHATITLGVTNYGTIPVTGLLPIQVFASASGSLDANSILLGTFTRRIAIPAGKSRRVPIVIPLPSTAGSYTLVAALDPQNTLNDIDLSNNIFTSQAALTVS